MARANDIADALIAEGNRAESSGKLREACEQYRKAVLAAPDYAKAHLNLGIGLEAAGDIDAAIRSYEAALAIERRSNQRLGPLEIPALAQHLAEVVIGVSIARIDRESRFIRSDRRVDVAGRFQSYAEIEMGFGVVGSGSHGLAVLLASFAQFA